ncbi:hypothetical protein OTK49_01755 [Vibrio coralliirubri]|uniref:hypothetical protein n=1 Tax=Vibrio coralliirubri TaxID=1516159 RepID=UPI00228473E5|nr:hypothetical protein [Vibrio coralliirubri]MCY9861238.1 hypothetical protein [Vibrio coralliirubri]
MISFDINGLSESLSPFMVSRLNDSVLSAVNCLSGSQGFSEGELFDIADLICNSLSNNHLAENVYLEEDNDNLVLTFRLPKKPTKFNLTLSLLEQQYSATLSY